MYAPQSIIGQSLPIMNNLLLNRRNHNRNGIFQLLNVYFVLTLCWCIGISVADDKNSCLAVQSIFELRGISKNEMPKTFTNGECRIIFLLFFVTSKYVINFIFIYKNQYIIIFLVLLSSIQSTFAPTF
jgi:hypothetical protein